MKEADDTMSAAGYVSDPQPSDPQQILEELMNQKRNLLAEITNIETQILQIDPRYAGQQNTIDHKNRLIGQLHSQKAKLLEVESNIDQQLLGHFKDFQKKKENFEIAAKEAHERVIKVQGLADDANKVAQDALDTATNAAGIAAAKPLVQHFEDRTNWLKLPFFIWILATAAFFAATIYFLVNVDEYLGAPDSSKGTEVALFISSKIIIVALLISGMIWCGKLFRDTYDKRGFYKHNIAITKTYQVFMESTQEPEVKDAILWESLKHIFSSPPSSHDSSKTEIEVIKNVPDIVQALATGNKNPVSG